LIFSAGFSTADVVTDISGRGVGMDVVRRTVEALRGRVDIQTMRGRGTTFSIRLPLTLAIVDGLLLQVGTQRFVVPTYSVVESLRPQAQQLHTVQGKVCLLKLRDQLLPLVRLDDLFGISDAASDPTAATVVVLEGNGRQVAVVVDGLPGKQEVVIKSLGDSFGTVRGVAGGAILGDGRIGLILDAHGIVALGRGGERRAA
jgi:two-component system chemotaxis sensor kinase CheA